MDLKLLGLEPWSTKSVEIGQTFGRLTIRAIGRKPGTYRYIAVCDCDCGKTEHLVRIDGLKNGSVASCGCGQIDAVSIHGRWKHPLYRKWVEMLKRCENPESERYPYYGARGIKICERWHDLESFISDMEGSYFPGAELDRKDVNGNYEPDNCRWATHSEQAANKTTTMYLTVNGKTQRLVEWSKETGIAAATLRRRVRDGWPADRVILEAVYDAETRCQLARNARGKNHQ